MTELTTTAETVLKRRYYLKDENNNPTENWELLSHRVAAAVSGKNEDLRDRFFQAIHDLDFLPNSPCLMNAGTDLGQLSACFVLPIEDSMDGIFTAIKNGALVHKTGGGTGYSFSSLRSRNAAVRSTQGVASGPLSFAAVFDAATETIKQGGKRRGANMGVMLVDHPDIMDFISAKEDSTKFNNFNFSVAITDSFMAAVKAGESYPLIEPSTKEVIAELDAKTVFDKIIDLAWHNGEPGVLFIDAANRDNFTPQLGDFEATNPCWTGDTKVWTSEGPQRFDVLAKTGNDVLVLTQNDEGRLLYKVMRNPRRTASNAEILKVIFDNGTEVTCTPNHNIYLRDGSKVQAKDLRSGDSISSLYRFKANKKGYKRLTNGTDTPLEHHLNAEIKYGRRPNYPAEHCHHLDERKNNNHWSNLEILPAAEHNALNMKGENNPMSGIWDERNPLFSVDTKGKNNGRYRNDIDDNVIRVMREAGFSIAVIAKEIGCSSYTVSKRLGWERPAVVNHKVVSIINLSEKVDVYNGTVDDTHRYFVMCGDDDAILSANCGEQWLLPYESCNLGSINLSNFVKNGQVDYERLGKVTKTATVFLDQVIDCNKFPIPEIEEMTLKTRKIGLGIMGLHDMLIQMEIPYSSENGRQVASDVMQFIRDRAEIQSMKSANVKGPFPAFDAGINHYGARRNAALTSIQPTGTVSMIADCASGCEPYFAVVMVKHVMDGDKLLMVNKHFEQVARQEGFFSKKLMEKVADSGTVIGHSEIPVKWQEIFRTAQDISAEDHILMQASLQNNGVDSSISKTINLPNNATREDVELCYKRGHELGCKGLTIYRDGSRSAQVLNAGPQPVAVTPATIKQSLPDTLNAKRYRLKDQDQKAVYIIVCFDEKEQPMEVFAKFPFDNRVDLKDKSTMWTTTCRLVSLALRCNVPITEIIKQLDRSSGHMLDLPAQLSKLFKSFMASTQHGFVSDCPDCPGKLTFEEGCETCHQCGYSKCS